MFPGRSFVARRHKARKRNTPRRRPSPAARRARTKLTATTCAHAASKRASSDSDRSPRAEEDGCREQEREQPVRPHVPTPRLHGPSHSLATAYWGRDDDGRKKRRHGDACNPLSAPCGRGAVPSVPRARQSSVPPVSRCRHNSAFRASGCAAERQRANAKITRPWWSTSKPWMSSSLVAVTGCRLWCDASAVPSGNVLRTAVSSVEQHLNPRFCLERKNAATLLAIAVETQRHRSETHDRRRRTGEVGSFFFHLIQLAWPIGKQAVSLNKHACGLLTFLTSLITRLGLTVRKGSS